MSHHKSLAIAKYIPTEDEENNAINFFLYPAADNELKFVELLRKVRGEGYTFFTIAGNDFNVNSFYMLLYDAPSLPLY